MSEYWNYLKVWHDGTVYPGYTSSLKDRLSNHRSMSKDFRFVPLWSFDNKEDAQNMEYALQTAFWLAGTLKNFKGAWIECECGRSIQRRSANNIQCRDCRRKQINEASLAHYHRIGFDKRRLQNA